MTKIQAFTQSLLAWHLQHGRHDLPWQYNPTPYRVWVSEIMLQQTQVKTVIDYYQQFMNTFSSITLLSDASQDNVLAFWSGLGYYSRARSLHRCAQIICTEFDGEFPRDLNQLCKLPGIGRSTAGAILSLGMQIRAPILDGNVKRVLTRYHAIEGYPQDAQVTKQLWDLAEQHTPTEQFANYNQAIMDLGATICTRSRPKCNCCPVANNCTALAQSRPLAFPFREKKVTARPKKLVYLLILKTQDKKILLEKRPPTGIWGGLWSFPECLDKRTIKSHVEHRYNISVQTQIKWPAFRHQFTHFELTIHPVLLTIKLTPPTALGEPRDQIWYHLSAPLPGGIATPISKLLHRLREEI